MRLGVDPKYPDQQVRGSWCSPTGRERACASRLRQGEKVKEAEDAGADFVGSDDLLAKIQAAGSISTGGRHAGHDGGVGRIGKLLGPRG